ncbi:MAG TPA: ribonucleoside triphosphate reductase, partial [Firmicutes bacterium]|nr:ribonucleoside triphosphate reductase [Bacillota bacterium]
MLEKIRKRDGRLVPYDRSKIATAIFKAAQAVGGGDRERAEKLAQEVEELLQARYQTEIPEVEDIQDLVEKVLIEHGHARTAKAYILYRQQHAEWRSLERLVLDVEQTVLRYLDGASWRVNENSNMDYSLQGLNNHIIGAVTSR